MKILVAIFASILILISAYQLSFTWFVNKHESAMAEKAKLWTKNHYATAAAKYPGDIARIRKQYFSSDDQLVTLYLAALGGSPEATLSQFKAARDVGARISIHVGVGELGLPQDQSAELLVPGSV